MDSALNAGNMFVKWSSTMFTNFMNLTIRTVIIQSMVVGGASLAMLLSISKLFTASFDYRGRHVLGKFFF